MKYLRVEWSHAFPDEPICYLSEVGDDGYEIRKVQVYRDGRSEWADGGHETDTVGLAETPFPPSLEEINSQPEFRATQVSQQDFEVAWTAARRLD